MDVYQRRRLVALSGLAAIFIVFVLLIRSCGGDDEPTPTPIAGASGASGVAGATSLSKADYIAQADQICLETNNSIAGVDTSAPTADADLSDIVAGELQQLQSLPPPTEDTSTLDDFLSALDKQADAYDDKAKALERGDDAAAAEIDGVLDKASGQAADAAAAFGFDVCGDTSQVSNDDSSGGDTDTDTATDTGGAVTPATTTPVAPTTTTPVTPAPDTGTVAPPATDDGTGDTGTDSGSGGVSP